MSWQDLQKNRIIQSHQTSLQEIDDLKGVVKRDLNDASVSAVSADGRFSMAYNAVLTLCEMAVKCAGYRVIAKKGHHFHTLEAARLAIGSPFSNKDQNYFNTCRSKRNTASYDSAGTISDAEADEIFLRAKVFRQTVEDWIESKHPELLS